MSKVRYAVEAFEILDEALGVEQSRKLYDKPRVPAPKREKVLVFGDTHAPFVRWDQLAKVIEREKDAHRVVLMGDLDDGYAISRYVKYDRVPYMQGIAGAKAVIETVSERFPNVDVIEGNHDSRLKKALYTSLAPDVIDAIKFLTKGNLSPIAAVCAEYPNVRVAGRDLTSPSQTSGKLETKTIGWLHQYGNVVFTHAERFSKVSGQAAEAVANHLALYRKVFKLDPFRVVIQAHTHQLAWRPWGSDGLVVESGCLAHTPGYALDPACKGVPQRNGYVTFEMVNGRVDIGSVRPHWLED
jgi:predicted phosphodiesterase